MSNTETLLEQKCQDANLQAPRLTPAHIDNTIQSETYTVLPDGRTTVCQLTLTNGFTVIGTSSCISIENFNEEIGKISAKAKARDKVWEVEAYLLKEKIYQAEQTA